MNNYLSIFQGILSTKGSYLDIYLDGLKDHRKFCSQSNESGELVQHITSLLTKSDTRSLGICLLASFVEDCSIDILEKKGNLWISLLLKSLNVRESNAEAHLTFDVLEKLVKKSQKSVDLTKAIASTYLCKIYESLVNVSLPKVKYALKCIETCLRVFPSASGPYRGLIDRFLWKNVISIDEEVIQGCGKCLHLLQQVKGGGVLGINHKMQWKTYQVQLISGIHAVYDEMFANCTELYDEKVEKEKLPWDDADLFSYDVEPVKKAAQLSTRCHNLIKFLELALREPFPVEKPILVKKIFNIINRGLGVNCIMLEQNPIADNIALSILFPKLHVDLLELLTALMSILHGQLRPYSEFVLGMLVDSIKWTSDKNVNEDKKVLQNLRVKVYDTLSRWCKIFHSGNRVDTIAEYLIQQILNDITPVQNEFTLKVLSGARKHMSKKARRQLHNIHNEKSNIFQTHSNDGGSRKTVSEECDKELCISALRCLQNILFSSSNFIKPTIIKSAQIHVTRICAFLCEHPPKDLTHLYGNKNCRMEVYNTIYAIIMSPHALCPPPTEIVFAVLRTAFMRDPSLKVRIHCGFILQNLEKLIHPQKEGLLFTIDARDIRNTFIKYGQEGLMHETAVQFSSEQTNIEIENYETEDEMDGNESNSKNDNPINENQSYCKLKNSLLLSNHFHSPNIQVNNIESGMEKPLEHSSLNDICETYAIEDTDVIESLSEKDLYNRKLLEEKVIRNEEISLTVSDDVSSSKSPNFVLRIDDGETTMDDYVTENKENIDEPKSKKQKFDEELELNADEEIVDNSDIKYDENEDAVVADIVSQFVDELD